MSENNTNAQPAGAFSAQSMSAEKEKNVERSNNVLVTIAREHGYAFAIETLMKNARADVLTAEQDDELDAAVVTYKALRRCTRVMRNFAANAAARAASKAERKARKIARAAK